MLGVGITCCDVCQSPTRPPAWAAEAAEMALGVSPGGKRVKEKGAGAPQKGEKRKERGGGAGENSTLVDAWSRTPQAEARGENASDVIIL